MSMLDKSVAIAALARNCEENLLGNIERIEKLRNCFSSSYVFLYENNSIDNTKAILKDWQNKSTNVYVITEDIDESIYRSAFNINKFYAGTSDGRIRKMCDCRNNLLKMIWSQGCYDFVIFIDIDIEWFSVTGVVNSIYNAPEGWVALFSNCYSTVSYKTEERMVPLYYDTFAFLDCNQSIERLRIKDLNKVKRFFLSSRLFKKANKYDYYECNSAFGGIGIYNYQSIKGIRYYPYKPKTWIHSSICLCEHIYYNHNIQGPKFIAKGIKVKYANSELSLLNWVLYKVSPWLYCLGALFKGLIMRK